jgi:hypothetical protein
MSTVNRRSVKQVQQDLYRWLIDDDHREQRKNIGVLACGLCAAAAVILMLVFMG